MNKTKFLVFVWMFSLVLTLGKSLQAQQANDMVFINGKIVTVDNHGFSSQLGTIAQAMHVQNGKILHVGTTAQIRAMAGANTKVIDLKGRTVLPGFILTHEHPWDWGPVTPQIVKKVLPNDDNVVVRVMTGSPPENEKAFPAALTEAVSKAKPGEWIYFIFTLGKDYEYSMSGNGGYGRAGFEGDLYNVLDGKHITKEQLNQAAPNNPILLRDVFTATVMNQLAVDASIKVFPSPRMNGLAPPSADQPPSSTPARSEMRWMAEDVMLKDHYPILREMQRLSLSYWAGYGMTAYASNAYSPTNIKVWRDLESKDAMPVRNMWTWNWDPEYHLADSFFMNDITSRVGEGTNSLWFGGVTISVGNGCTVEEPLATSSLAKLPSMQIEARVKQCAYTPGSRNAKELYDYIKAGGRFVNMHTVGDEDIDNIMKTIVQASKDSGMTDEEIRAKRHGFDHSVMWPRPDQIPTMKQYGFYASGDAFEITQASPAVFNIFGEKAASNVVPKKRLVTAGIYNTIEMDRAIPATDYTIFNGVAWLINRKAWDGKAYATDQAVDRQTALKISTIYGAYYVLRENLLGSLEPGKFADFMVLDKDYLTVPEDDIANLHVLMTVKGGKVTHLVPSMAKETGMQPTGAQVELNGPAAGW